jgi:dTDP-4-dehydrorhamnose 3,5-epimerase-like enzyme
MDWWYAVRGKIKWHYLIWESSPTHKKVQEFMLSGKCWTIKSSKSPGVAHGLKVIEGPADLVYVTSGIYSKDEEGRIAYDDPTIGYDWVQGMPITNKNIT